MSGLRPIRPTPLALRRLAEAMRPTSGGDPPRYPTAAHLRFVVDDEADREGEHPCVVLGACMRQEAVRARYRAFIRIMDESGCSILGLAKVWGADRRSIQRAVMLAARDARLDPYRLRSERRAA